MIKLKNTLLYICLCTILLSAVGCSLSNNLYFATSEIETSKTDTVQDIQVENVLIEPAYSEADTNRDKPKLDREQILQLAYPYVSGESLNRAVFNISDWPDMLYLRETAFIGSNNDNLLKVTPLEIRIIPGSSVPLNYNPVDDITKTKPETFPDSLRQFPGKPVVFIPPNISLVMVRIETDPSIGRWVGQDDYPGTTAGAFFECPEQGTDFLYNPEKFRLSYPGVGESPVYVDVESEYWLGDYQPVGTTLRGDCPSSGWLYFYVPSMDIVPNNLWMEYIGGRQAHQLAFWTMTDRP